MDVTVKRTKSITMIAGMFSPPMSPLSLLGPDYKGVAITFAMLSSLALVSGLIWFLFQRKRFQWAGSSSVRYEQGVNEDEIVFPFFHD